MLISYHEIGTGSGTDSCVRQDLFVGSIKLCSFLIQLHVNVSAGMLHRAEIFCRLSLFGGLKNQEMQVLTTA